MAEIYQASELRKRNEVETAQHAQQRQALPCIFCSRSHTASVGRVTSFRHLLKRL